MSVYKNNAKIHRDGRISCICGSTRTEAKLLKHDEDEEWIEISCKKCGKLLFYNGA